MVFKQIQRYTGRYAEMVGHNDNHIMTWRQFVARVERQSRLDDSAIILDIDVTQPNREREFDLCVLAGMNHRYLWDWIFIKHPGWKQNGYLLVWKDRGGQRFSGPRTSWPQIPKSVVLTPEKANRSLTWKKLRSLVEGHPQYRPDLQVNTIDIDSCSPDLITIEITNDEYKPSITIRGEPQNKGE